MGYEIDSTCQSPAIVKTFDLYFGYKTNGVFVEVGAFDGKTHGCSWGLSRAGWRGLYIEGMPEFMTQCKLNHAFNPKIEFEECCASDIDGTGKLYICGDCSSINLNEWSRAWGAGQHGNVEVPFKTMNTILAAHNWPSKYDVLIVDVEEAELKVLAGYDLRRWFPHLIVIELHEGNGAKGWKVPEATRILSDYGYRKIYTDPINTVFCG